MKAFRLYNLTELSPASPLHFLEKAGAEAYRDYVKWPYEKTGRFPLRDGSSVRLADLDLRTEEVEINAVAVPSQELLLIERDGLIGLCYLLPGNCYNPDDWAPASAAELAYPEAGVLLDQAKRHLR